LLFLGFPPAQASAAEKADKDTWKKIVPEHVQAGKATLLIAQANSSPKGEQCVVTRSSDEVADVWELSYAGE
jgi:hypothetical protein